MLILLFLMSLALAEEPLVGDLQIPSNAKPLTVPVYPGTSIRFTDENGVKLSEAFQLGYQAYLVPEFQLDQLLAAQENLMTCRTALGTCHQLSREIASDALQGYQLAREQFASDEMLVTQQAQTIVELEHDLARERGRLQRVRTQRNIAWAITGGLVLGAVTTTAVVIGTP